MREGRIPAQVSVLVSRPDINLCGTTHSKVDNSAANAENQPSVEKIPGNGCFHNPKKFHYAIKKEKSNLRPHCIEEAKRRLKHIEREKFKYVNFIDMIFKPSGRQKKSEARERDMNLFGQIILDTLNITVMKCGAGMTNKNVFVPWSLKYICGKYQDNEGRDLDYKRMLRALEEYQRCGYVDVNEIRKEIKKPTGEVIWRTIDVEILVGEKIFRDLNLYDEFLADRRKALMKMINRQHAINEKKQENEKYKHYSSPKKGFFSAISKKLNPNRTQTQVGKEAKNSSGEQQRKSYNAAPTAAQKKEVLDLATQIIKQHPHIKGQEAIEIAKRKLYGH